MESVLRAAFMYFFLLFILRISGKRTLAEITLFDFVLVLIIGDASQQAITANDYSVINGIIVVSTLILIDKLFSLLKIKFPKLERIMDGQPLVIVVDGKPQAKLMRAMEIEEEDILESARKWRGIARMDEIKYAILEKDGGITIVPK